MKGFVWHDNKTASLDKRPVPQIKDKRDAIVKVTMSSICTSDLHIIRGFVPKAVSETILGHEFVGEVVDVGSDIKNLKKGDRVSANCETFCGQCYFCKRGFINNCLYGGWEIGCTIDGCQAEYVRVPFADTGLTKLPDNVSYENALFVGDILSSGYWGAELCEIQKGDTVAVIGAGPVGLCSMMSAKLLGAEKIIAIDVDDTRLEIAKNQNLADVVINPLNSDVEKEVKDLTERRGADSVIEAAGGKDTFQTAWKIARANAIVALVAMYEENQTLPLPDMYGKNLTFKTGGVDAVNCSKLVDLISEKKINTDFLITHKFSLDNIQQAYKLFENKSDNCLKIAIVN
ncbi:TPA: alcohol dehydrogenase [Candidatus Gastranaerophilales bacterium HUM_20]|nr:MAG TPA: alcohol dehydrogenase [Candidatus Gastranaerophilales bacterium HUM_20]